MSNHVIDLRSDTVTQPSPEMRRAMADAWVGDDFYGEDPTVRELEAQAADLTGKEAGLFVASGTMGNLVAHLTHCPSGGEVVGPEDAHTFKAEVGGFARVAGLTARTVRHSAGRLDLDGFEARISDGSLLRGATRLVWVEQPIGGFIVPLSDLHRLKELAEGHGVPVHMDGARIFNAAVGLGVPPSDIASFADTVTFCISKGLAAPVGSLIVGSADFIERARVNRQLLGGGMRQAGILAAAGLHALAQGTDQLVEDHANARRLAAGFSELPGFQLDRDRVDTNIFYGAVRGYTTTTLGLVARFAADGILVNRPGIGAPIRFVTHLGISETDIDLVIASAAQALMPVPEWSAEDGLGADGLREATP